MGIRLLHKEEEEEEETPEGGGFSSRFPIDPCHADLSLAPTNSAVWQRRP